MTDRMPTRPTSPAPPRATSLDLILDDHRRFEALLRELRDSSADRDAVRRAFAALHVAHAEAEEAKVYPTLRRKDAIDEHEAEHGEEEHAEGNEALLAVLEAERVEGEAFDDLVEELAGEGQPPPHRGGADHPQPGPRGGRRGRTSRARRGVRARSATRSSTPTAAGSRTSGRIVARAGREGLLSED